MDIERGNIANSDVKHIMIFNDVTCKSSKTGIKVLNDYFPVKVVDAAKR